MWWYREIILCKCGEKIMNLNNRKQFIETRNECMSQYALKELIAELRGDRHGMERWHKEHCRCGKEVLEVLLK